MKILKILAIVVAMAVAVTGCATVGPGGGPLTSDQKIANCAGMILGGAVIAKLLGKAPGTGAAVGAAGCAVWLAFNNKRDKERIDAARLSALEAGTTRQDNWRGDDGKMRTVKVSAGTKTPMLTAKETGVYCRQTNTEVKAEGVGADSMQGVWCRKSDGAWVPQNQILASI